MSSEQPAVAAAAATSRGLLARAVRLLFPLDDVVLRATGVAVLVVALFSVVPLAWAVSEQNHAAGWLFAGSTAVLVAVAVVIRQGRDSPGRGLVGVAVLGDLAAFLFALAMVLARSGWWQLLPMVFVLVTVLVALSLPAPYVWSQVGVCLVAVVVFVELAGSVFWALHHVADRRLEDYLRTAGVSLAVGMSLVLVASSVRGLLARLRTATAQAESVALRDTLTGALNRRGLEAGLDALVAAAGRSGSDVTVLVVDLDHFKRVNDTHGHAAGDAVLTATVRALRAVTRQGDLVARLGGEEFAVVSITTPAGPGDRAVAWTLAERVRVAVNEANAGLGVTVSVGAVQRPPPPRRSPGNGSADAQRLVEPEWLYRQVAEADRLLYEAKRGGRNRSVVTPPPPVPAAAAGSGAVGSTTEAGQPARCSVGSRDGPDGPDAPGGRDGPGMPGGPGGAGRPRPDTAAPTARRRTDDRHRGRRPSRRRAVTRPGARRLRLLGAWPARLFPNDSPALRGTALTALFLTPLSSCGLLLNLPWGPGALYPFDIASALCCLATSILVLWSRRDLRRVLVPVLVLLHVAVAAFGMSQASLAAVWPIAFLRGFPVFYVLFTVLVALTLSARAVRRQVAAATVLTAWQYSLLAVAPWPWPQLGAVVGTGLVLLALVATAGSIRLLLGRLETTLTDARRRGETDALTALANRRGMERRVGALVARARRSNARLLVLVADLDHFKQVNDCHSHATGDQVLRTTARALSAAVQRGVVARFGGEEFVVVAVVDSAAEASALAERLRRRVKAANGGLGVTASVGGVHRLAATVDLDPVPWLHSCVEDADDLLYLAKGRGRDRCVVAESLPGGALVADPEPAELADRAEPTDRAGPTDGDGPTERSEQGVPRPASRATATLPG